ncbi:hypothetical protein [Thaumasiovibrio subtropicus]|uniref:hypothetical protein n=1 Tax=Thaumasiovibrio subtropicus TaxID=1891207 RepID=UPI000B34E3FD|nr:hypothetical protein [Thaumasiovibrio subtropicus]
MYPTVFFVSLILIAFFGSQLVLMLKRKATYNALMAPEVAGPEVMSFLHAYQRVVESNCTPYVEVNTSVSGVVLPEASYQRRALYINLSVDNIHKPQWQGSQLTFKTRLSQGAFTVTLPMQSIVKIYPLEKLS